MARRIVIERKKSSIPRVYIKGKENMTSSNLAKKPKKPNTVSPNKGKAHAKPIPRKYNFSIKKNTSTQKKDTQNKRLWINNTSKGTIKTRKLESVVQKKNTSMKSGVTPREVKRYRKK